MNPSNPYIPKDGVYPSPPEPNLYIRIQYERLMERSWPNGSYSIIRPVFLWDYPTWHKTQYELDQSKRMKNGECMVPVLTGVRTRDTRVYMEGLIQYIREREWVCISGMEAGYYNEWMQRDEYKDLSDSERRFKALRLKANAHRRMILASIIANNIVLTRESWDQAYKHIYSRTLPQYIMLMEAAIVLPKQWCDDEYINI